MQDLTIDRTHFPRLKQLWGAGLSALECGAEIGLAGDAAAVREAVLRALEEINKPQPKAPKPVRPLGYRKPPKSRYADPDPLFATDGVNGTPAPSDLEIPQPQRRTLLELDGDTCKWPVGDPASAEFFFCGAKPLDGRPYCLNHCRRAYVGVSRRVAA